MNITSPIMAGAVRAADLPGDSVTSLLRMIGLEPGCSTTMSTAALAS